MQYDFSGSSGLDFGNLAASAGAFGGVMNGTADTQGGYESGSGFWTFANKGIDALAGLGGGWLALQSQSRTPQYQGQPEQTREQGVFLDGNAGPRPSGQIGGMLLLALGAGLVLLTLHLQKG